MPTELQGQIDRIVYCNEENGYTVARVKVSGRKETVTVVGSILSATPGEILTMQGEWSAHPRFGEQFKVTRYETVTPATVHGIEKYLGSGLIKGIGPVMAKRIVEKFGTATLDIIEKKVHRLTDVEGIGTGRIEMIKAAWDAQKEIREVMLFLQSHDVSSAYATKIFKHYGKASIGIVRENPYRLATDIFGIGFLTADKIAEKLGIAKDSLQRTEAGILYALQQLSEAGHVYYPYELLVDTCRDMLQVERDTVIKALGALAADRRIILEDLNESTEEFKENNKAVYLARYHVCETGIAEQLKALIVAPRSMLPGADAEKIIARVQATLPIVLAEKQLEAVRHALTHKVMVITGGPGTGKTTIIQALLKIFAQPGMDIMLAAPTGRAAKRMTEATGFAAKTIHRLLKYTVQSGGFEKNEHDPLTCDLLIIDEASMVDTILMYHVLKAVPKKATLILVGDVNQLPSVGAGNVLKDIISSQAIKVVELNEIFRQARESLIIVNAHRIN
ncbi:MAG: AAA family ATPase, partial [Pseudomonadota bacterium]